MTKAFKAQVCGTPPVDCGRAQMQPLSLKHSSASEVCITLVYKRPLETLALIENTPSSPHFLVLYNSGHIS